MAMSKKQRMIGGLIALITGRDDEQKRLDQQAVKNQQGQQQIDISQQRADDTADYYEFQRERQRRRDELEDRQRRIGEREPNAPGRIGEEIQQGVAGLLTPGFASIRPEQPALPTPQDIPAPKTGTVYDTKTGQPKTVQWDEKTGQWKDIGGPKALPKKVQRTARSGDTIYPVPNVIPEGGFTLPGGETDNNPPPVLVAALDRFLTEGFQEQTQDAGLTDEEQKFLDDEEGTEKQREALKAKGAKQVKVFTMKEVSAIEAVRNGKGTPSQKTLVAGILQDYADVDELFFSDFGQRDEALNWLRGGSTGRPVIDKANRKRQSLDDIYGE